MLATSEAVMMTAALRRVDAEADADNTL